MECFYGVCDAHSRLARAGCTKTQKEPLACVKWSVRHLWFSGCKDWARVPEKRRRALDENARFGVLLRFLSYGRFWIMLKDDRTVETTWHCFVREDVCSL